MPKVSVIIPTYNCAKYLPEAIGSVLSQIYQDFEIIIVDDGSTDDTNKIVHKYVEKYPNKIRYFYQANAGPGAGRNRGIEEAKGEYVAFLDGDDILLKNSLARRIEFFSKYPGVNLVFADYYLKEHEDGQIDNIPMLKKSKFLRAFSQSINFKDKDEFIFDISFYYNYLTFRPYPICMDTGIIRKKIVKDTGLFRTDINISEDSDFWLRVIEKNKVGYIDQPTAVYNRFITNSLSRRTEERYLDTLKQLFLIYKDKNNKLSKRILKKKIANAFSSLAYYYFSIYNLKFARKYFLSSIKYRFFQIKTFAYLSFSILPISLIKYLRNIKATAERKTI